MQIRGTDFVMFFVSDLRRATAFYRDVLGLRSEVYSEAHRWAEFDCGNITLSLMADAVPAGTKAGGRIAFAVADIFVVYTELQGRGIETIGAPVDHGCCRHLEVHDPDGNTIFLHQRADGSFGQSVAAPGPAP